MQHFGAEIRQFRRFRKRDFLHFPGAGNDPGIGGHHAVHVRPNLDFLSIERSAHNGGGVVGGAPAQRGCEAAFGRTDIASHDDYASRTQMGRGVLLKPFTTRARQRNRTTERAIGDDTAAGIDVDGVVAV